MFFSIGFAQKQSSNRFEETEQEQNSEFGESSTAKEPEVASTPGNPDGDDDLPIDDYIPLLIIAAVGIIVYKSYTKNKTLS